MKKRSVMAMLAGIFGIGQSVLPNDEREIKKGTRESIKRKIASRENKKNNLAIMEPWYKARGVKLFRYEDGFSCFAINQKNADRKYTRHINNNDIAVLVN